MFFIIRPMQANLIQHFFFVELCLKFDKSILSIQQVIWFSF